MWKRSFRERPPSKSASGKTKLSCETSSNSDSWRCENVAFVRDLRPPWKSESWRCENEAFVRDLPENLKVEAVKTKLSCKTSLKKWKWKMWKRSLRARPPSNSDSWRCENVAFVRDLPENLKVEDVKTKLSCEGETSLKKWKWKMWKGSRLRARLETPLKIWKLKMWKWSFRARPPSKSESWRCENEAFVRDLPEKVKVEDVNTKLSCETSLKKWKLKMWKRSFSARPPWKVKVENVKSKFSCETSLKTWKWKMWQRSLAVRSLGCGISWLWDLLAVRPLVCEIFWLWDLLAVRSLGCDISWLWDLLAVRSLGCEISWLWDLLAVRSLGCEISWLWDLLALRLLGCEISWL